MTPDRTGSTGAPPTNALHTSVPPLMLETGIGATASEIQRYPASGRGAPVEPISRKRRRSSVSPGRKPALRHAMRKGAENPASVTALCSTIDHRVSKVGEAGSPSNMTIDAPASSPDIR